MDYKIPLFKPPEIEIDGKKYPFRKKNRSFYGKFQELEKTMPLPKEGEKFTLDQLPNLYERLKLYLDAPPEIIDDLDQSQVTEFVEIIGREINPGKDAKLTAQEVEVKNESKPGDGTVA